MSSFKTLDLHPALLRGVEDLGFTEPTPIQRDAIPPALEGRDVLAAAMTGSGKTAAFVLPLLQRLIAGDAGGGDQSRERRADRPDGHRDGRRRDGRRDDRDRGRGSQAAPRGTRVLVLVPTRELAAQVEEHVAALGRHTRIRSATVFGGVRPEPQLRALRAGVDVVIATPGRLLDLMGQGACRFDTLEALVLDEADRMLDMGFLPDVRRILAALPRRRQTMLFSATLPRPIVELSNELMENPVRLHVERKAAPAEGVEQSILPVPERLKSRLLLELLRRSEVETALVFTRTKHRANKLARFLEDAGVATDRIHGNRTQPQRERALAAFKNGRLRVLVATDIAARGIDVEALPHVVNYDVPGQPEDYIHRVGRTARARSTGQALTLVSPAEESDLRDIERAVGRSLPRRRVSGFDYDAAPSPSSPAGAKERRPGRSAAGPRPGGRDGRSRRPQQRDGARRSAQGGREGARSEERPDRPGDRRPAAPARAERSQERPRRPGDRQGSRPGGGGRSKKRRASEQRSSAEPWWETARSKSRHPGAGG